MIKKRIFMLFLVITAILSGLWVFHDEGGAALKTDVALFSQDYTDRLRLDVPFVPTKEEVLAEMIRMAHITRGDIVYDLGCGDGRIVIAAAEKSGATCVGVDIDPRRIRECRENALKAGVADRVKFYEKDLFDADIESATVVMLYLLPEVNLKLRPKLLKDLKPGTRIVSHNYDMKQWRPDDFKKVGSHSVYFWIVPANVTGTWKWNLQLETASRTQSMRLEQDFQNAKGWVTSGSSKMPVKDLRLVGDRLSFTIIQKIDGRTIPVRFVGQVNKNTISGSMFYGTNAERKKWTAKRDASTAAPLDGSRMVMMAAPQKAGSSEFRVASSELDPHACLNRATWH